MIKTLGEVCQIQYGKSHSIMESCRPSRDAQYPLAVLPSVFLSDIHLFFSDLPEAGVGAQDSFQDYVAVASPPDGKTKISLCVEETMAYRNMACTKVLRQAGVTELLRFSLA
ncbi:hypothetical protein WISP_83396 [Willisornis vidua]|uniref:Uncharacterized protein n=1 Tax=Willisornis vidua TaxID=1566151 RepID=A0ABQ9D3Z6_9PASS|nr:hypothetical protein WISP_83396 [Willisornis vidua]